MGFNAASRQYILGVHGYRIAAGFSVSVHFASTHSLDVELHGVHFTVQAVQTDALNGGTTDGMEGLA